MNNIVMPVALNSGLNVKAKSPKYIPQKNMLQKGLETLKKLA